MKLIRLHMRGAIGTYEGLNQDEIDIDFTKFSRGIIAMCGDNGASKSTTMGFLPPFLQWGSDKGSISNYFRLKDSFIDRYYELGGKDYRSHVLIDAQTGKIEAYLYADGNPLNDGKVPTYKEQVEKIFGSRDLFFGSVFSEQNRKGIIDMTDGERKELFYQILNLQKYEEYAKTAGDRAAEIETAIAEVRGKIGQLETDISNKMDLQNNIESYEKIVTSARMLITNLTNEHVVLQKEFAEIEKQEIEEREKQKQIEGIDVEILNLQAERTNRIVELTKSIDEVKLKIEPINAAITRILKIMQNKELVDIGVKKIRDMELNDVEMKIAASKVQELRTEIAQFETGYEKAVNEYNQKGVAVAERYKKELSDTKELISNNRLEFQKEEIEYNRKVSDLTGNATKAINDVKAGYQNDLREYESKKSAAVLDIQKAESEYVRAKDLVILSVERLNNEIEISKDALNRAKASASLTNDVPCKTLEGIPGQCKLLTAAFQSKHDVLVLEQDLSEIKNKGNDKVAVADESLKLASASLELARAAATAITMFDKGIYDGQINAIQECLKNDIAEIAKPVNTKEADLLSKVDEINRSYNDEAATISLDTTNLVKSVELMKQIKTIGYTEKAHKELAAAIEKLKAEGWEALQEELKTAEAILAEKRTSLETHQQSITAFQTHLDVVCRNIDNKLKALEDKKKSITFDSKLLIKKCSCGSDITRNETAISIAREELESEQSILSSKKSAMETIKVKEDQVDKLRAENEGKSVQAEQWRLVQQACGKDGIPALEIDASGGEVTRIANELLTKNFGTEFQIQFETTRRTKDGKKQTETFDIKVFRSNGKEQQAKTLSGGEKVWVEQAVEDAIRVFLDEKSQREYATIFADERDGALSAENKQRFLDMIQQSMVMSNRYHYLMITHTPELLAQIPQRIVFKKGIGIECVY